MTHKTFPQRLDDLARWTGIPAITARYNHPRRRPQRAWSTLAIVAATAGLVVAVGWPALRWPGYAVLVVAFSVANFLPMFGPLKPWGTLEPIDERERATRARAFLIALSVISFVSVVGMWSMVAMSALGDWNGATLRLAIVDLAFYVAALYSALPTCVASWAERRLPDEDD